MYKSDVVTYYGKLCLVTKALKLSSGYVSQWGDIIPEKQALKLERLTNGALKYNPALYEKKQVA